MTNYSLNLWVQEFPNSPFPLTLLRVKSTKPTGALFQPKKKKSVKKEADAAAEKPAGDGLAPPPTATTAERKPSLTPDGKPNEESKSRKTSSAIDVPEKKEGKSRKTSAVDGPQKGEEFVD